MAKQRRPAQKSPKRAAEAAVLPRPEAPAATTTPEPSGPQRRSTYFEAVALYERGVDALQRHAYPQEIGRAHV